jgi:hypothetical protein
MILLNYETCNKLDEITRTTLKCIDSILDRLLKEFSLVNTPRHYVLKAKDAGSIEVILILQHSVILEQFLITKSAKEMEHILKEFLIRELWPI